jgi:hypothetical protein
MRLPKNGELTGSSKVDGAPKVSVNFHPLLSHFVLGKTTLHGRAIKLFCSQLV